MTRSQIPSISGTRWARYSKKRMQGRQPLVASADVVVPFLLEVPEELLDALAGEVLERQTRDRAPGLSGDEAEEEAHGVAIASDRSEAKPFLGLEVIHEVGMDQCPQSRSGHGEGSSKAGRAYSSKRRLASCNRSWVMVR